MMKYFCSILFCCHSFLLLAQERLPLSANVRNEENVLENVHVTNVSTKKYALSDLQGNFRINAAVGDTLVLSHVGMNDLIKLLKASDFQSQPLQLEMTALNNELDEVLINEQQEINAVTLGILSEQPKIPTPMERKLQTAGDWKPIHLLGLLSGGIQLDPILNAISGRTKMLKKNIEVDKKINRIAFLNYNYYDYMLQELGIPENKLQLFIDYLLENNSLQNMIDSNNDARMKFYLHDNWIKFRETID